MKDFDAPNYLIASSQQDVTIPAIFQRGFSSLDGRGRLAYIDSFGNGMGGWSPAFGGVGASAPTLVTTPSGQIFSPPNAISLNCGATLGSWSGIYRQYLFGRNKKLGFEWGFVLNNLICNYEFDAYYKPTDNQGIAPLEYHARLRWNHDAGRYEILNNLGANVPIYTPGLFSVGTSFFAQIKMVCNFETGKYVRALFGDIMVDISAYSMAAGTAVQYPGALNHGVNGSSYGAGTLAGMLGYAMLTKDEDD